MTLFNAVVTLFGKSYDSQEVAAFLAGQPELKLGKPGDGSQHCRTAAGNKPKPHAVRARRCSVCYSFLHPMVMRGRQLSVEHLWPGAVSQRRFGVSFEAMAYKERNDSESAGIADLDCLREAIRS